ncbi:conjugative transposon protein TraM [Ekhidna sp.]
MSKLDKDQVKILAGFGIAIAVFVILFFVLTGESEQDVNKPQTSIRASSTLPSAPRKEKKAFTSKLDAAQQTDQGKEKAVSLDIFKVDDKEAEEEEAVFKTAPAPVKSQVRSTSRQRTVAKVEEEVIEEEPIYDDFSLSTSSSNSTQVSDEVSSSNVRIEAVIHDTQTVRDGQRVTLRITKAFELDGKRIRAGRFIHTTAKFEINRVHLDFSTLTYDNGGRVSVEPLAVFDATDRKRGVYSEQLSEQEFSGESGEDILDEVGDTNPNLGTKILKGLARKKLKEVSVQLRDNTKVIIK